MSEVVNYVVVPQVKYVIVRVVGDYPNGRELVKAVRAGRVKGHLVRSPSVVQWSKARVKREVLP